MTVYYIIVKKDFGTHFITFDDTKKDALEAFDVIMDDKKRVDTARWLLKSMVRGRLFDGMDGKQYNLLYEPKKFLTEYVSRVVGAESGFNSKPKMKDVIEEYRRLI
jgi:hypothetical protein